MNKDNTQYHKVCPSLFSPFEIGRCAMKNRVVALPVHTGFAHPDGQVSDWMLKFYTRLAGSGAGMVVVANAAVAEDGIVSRFNLRADHDRFLPGLSRLSGAIKAKGALACLQLNHAGRFAKTPRPLMPSAVTSSNLSFNVESLKQFMEFFPFEKRFGLTRYFLGQLKNWRQAMTSQEKERVVTDFAAAADRASRAGFDMVELHGGNGYLLCQYFSRFTNKLGSGYGGSFKARARFPLKVVKAVREILPKEYPVGYRLILKEWVPKGVELPEALEFAKLLECAGIGYLSASVGSYSSIFSPEAMATMSGQSYLNREMKLLTTAVQVPTVASGRISLPSQAETVIRDGIADLAGLGRPLRSDLEWLKKAGDSEKKIVTCINCNRCIKQVVLEQGFNCRRWPRMIREQTRLEHRLLTRNYNSVWVVSDKNDIRIFKQSWPLVRPDRDSSSRLSLVGLKTVESDPEFDLAQTEFVNWMKYRLDPLSLTNQPLSYAIREHKDSWDEVLADEIQSEEYGQVFMGTGREKSWREKLFYRERGRVLALLSGNRRQKQILVPVDLSSASLLVMAYLARTLMKKKELEFTFLHVRSDRSVPVTQRWQKYKKIVGFKEGVPLRVVSPSSDVVSTIVDMVESRGYGTIIMGKRGLSGIKRWLLGSVSAGVLERMTHQSIFIID